MKTYHRTDEGWYMQDWSLFHRLRDWFIWVGGWEKANGGGWRIFLKTPSGRLRMPPTPVSLFGRRITFHRWWVDIRLRKGWLVVSKTCAYLSPDATPSAATAWYFGTPPDIKAKASR